MENTEEANSLPGSGTAPNSNEHELSKKVEDKQMAELNGEIGHFLNKGTQFVLMTNLSVLCTRYVTENAESGSSEGFLYHVIPKTTFVNGEEDNPAKKC